MRILSRKTLRLFWEKKGYADAEQPLKAWFQEVERVEWRNPAHVKAMFRNASVVGNERIVFNIAGNKYRLIVKINYHFQMVFIRFIGTHAQYDKVNATEI